MDVDDEEAELCATCARIGWDAVLGGTLTDSARDMFSMRHLYKLDGTDGTGAPFLRGPVVSIAAMAEDPPECPLCHLWLRSYQRVYPEREPSKDTRGSKDSWFIYHVGESDYGEQWRGNPRGIDDDTQSWATRKKAMQQFRLRFRRYEDVRNFESELELTCLDEHLPSETRSRGGRLLPDDGCSPERLEEWMRLCKAEHGSQCDSDVSDEVLTGDQAIKLRLIDVDTLRVVVRSFDDDYCALSYVWGPLISFRAEQTYFQPDRERPGEVFLDLRPFLNATGPDSVPATVVDAIEVTRRLGQRYLWVDAICIMKEPQESAHSIAAMDIIYKKAILSIVAAAGSDCTAGLPRAHPDAPRLTQITEQVLGRTFMLAQPSLNVVLKNSVWSTRAWTFQETKLSSRQLIFSDSGVYFRCQKDTWAEDSVEKIVPRRRLGRMGRVMYASAPTAETKREAVFADYTYDVRSYTARSLGRQEDALNAFTGLIANMRRTTLPTEFHWGLPRRHMDAALLWKGVDNWAFQFWAYRPVKDGLPERQRRSKLRAATRGYTWMDETEQPTFRQLQRRTGFPSWSWCGWQGHTGYFPRTTTQPDLFLLKSIRGRIKWPWDAPQKDDWGNWATALRSGCLTFRAWRARVDFDKLPYGSPPKNDDRKAWTGWPMDGEAPLLHGEHDCILLSRQLRHPVAFSGLMFEHYRTLDPINKTYLVNVMVLGREGDREYRRGVGMMREDFWWKFEPKWTLMQLY